MGKLYLLSDGSYSDYEVMGLVESPSEITEKDWGIIKAEAIKRKDKKEAKQLQAVLNWLQSKGHISTTTRASLEEIRQLVGYEVYHMALIETHWGYVSEEDCIEEVLKERGCTLLGYEEINMEDITAEGAG